MQRIALVASFCALLAACERAPEAENGGNVSAEPSGPEGATRRFVNRRAFAASPRLQEHYVDFSFQYPRDWAVTPQPTDGSASNYVRVAAPSVDGFEPYAFHVGSAYGTGIADADAREIEAALPGVAERFGASFGDYRIISVGRDQVGPYPSWTWRFSATAPGRNGGRPAQIFGRGDIVLPPGAAKGVLLLTVATDRTDEVSEAGQIGETGTTRAVFDSFRIQARGM